MRGILECCKIRVLVFSAVTRFRHSNNSALELRLNSNSSRRPFSGIDKSFLLHNTSRMNFSTHSDLDPEFNSTCQITVEEDLKPAANALVELIESKKTSNLVLERKALLFCEAYRSLKNENKAPILNQLADIWSSRQDVTLQFAKKYISAQEKGEEAAIKAEDQLRNTLAVDQGWFLSSIARIEGGVRFLIDIRSDLLDLIGLGKGNSTSLKSLSNGIRDLIAPCFGVDLLHLERVTWSSPGNLLQKISEGEAVHPIRSWSDLKKRLGPYRRCFILTHPALPLQPLAILHVALTSDISSSIHSIISRSIGSLTSESAEAEHSSPVREDEDTQGITTSIFYSISSTQKGLTGIDLGQCLIKRAVRQLQSEIPSLSQFSTLSPIPGFRSWLLHQLRETERGKETALLGNDWGEFQSVVGAKGDQPWSELRLLLLDNSWIKDESQVHALEVPLMRLCAHYLYHEKRRGFALDSVANFHLRNGALLWRLNWLADLSPRGMKNSFGIMVNYRYILESCESNSQEYVDKQHIETSEKVHNLLRKPSPVSNLSRL